MAQIELARHPSFKQELKTHYFQTKADSLPVRRHIPTNASLDKAALVKDTKMSLVEQGASDSQPRITSGFDLAFSVGVVFTQLLVASRASEWARKIDEGTAKARAEAKAAEVAALQQRRESAAALAKQRAAAAEALAKHKESVRAAKEAVVKQKAAIQEAREALRQQRAERAAKRAGRG
jgi:hypothetical protein